MNTIPPILETGFALAMVAMAICDTMWRRLPNWLNALIAVAFLPYAWALGLTWVGIAWAVAAGAVILAAGFGLFSFGLIGAGDVKLAAAVAIWIGPSFDLLRFLLTMALAGGVLAAIVLVWQAASGKRATRPLPYGVAIAAAGLDHWFHYNHIPCLGSGC